MDIEVHPFDLRECVESALDLVAARAAQKQLDLAYVFEGDVPPAIEGDVTRLRQILLNLLSNAVKFTPAGGRVSLAVARAPRALHISVADTGAGISADLLPHVFERFRQGGGPSRRQGGLGLGLAIVRNLVELHGGTVTAQSDGEGRGATFEVILPAA